MKRNIKRLQTRFARETRFPVAPAPALPFRIAEETALEKLKAGLVRGFLNGSLDLDINTAFRRAANDAAAIAWASPFPLLVFPALLEEKVAQARLQARKQAEIRQRTLNLFAEAA